MGRWGIGFVSGRLKSGGLARLKPGELEEALGYLQSSGGSFTLPLVCLHPLQNVDQSLQGIHDVGANIFYHIDIGMQLVDDELVYPFELGRHCGSYLLHKEGEE